MIKNILLFIVLTIKISNLFSQEIKISNSNDAWFKTDRYYTEGLKLSYIDKHPILHLDRKSKLYFTNLTYDFFTPYSITDLNLRVNDRPYSGYLKLSELSIKNIKGFTIKSGYDIGIIGSFVSAKYIQTEIHKKINSPIPRGWKYQISNNLLLDYNVNITKNILNYRLLKYDIGSSFIIGTDDRIGLNSNLIIPYINTKFIEFYGYGSVGSNLVLWNPTLNGGFFNKSIYTIKWMETSRIVSNFEWGVYLRILHLGIKCSFTYISKEFNSGYTHKWNNIELNYRF